MNRVKKMTKKELDTYIRRATTDIVKGYDMMGQADTKIKLGNSDMCDAYRERIDSLEKEVLDYKAANDLLTSETIKDQYIASLEAKLSPSDEAIDRATMEVYNVGASFNDRAADREKETRRNIIKELYKLD